MDPEKKEKKEVTEVKEVNMSLDEILGTSVESVMTSAEGEETTKKPSIFSKTKVDTTFLDSEEFSEKTKEEIEEIKDKPVNENQIKKVTEELLAPPTADEVQKDLEDLEDLTNKGGRPSAMISAAKEMLEKGTLVPFNDADGNPEDITKYSAQDFQELIEANLKYKEQSLIDELPTQFMQQLPPELQQAYHYVAQGGTDMKGMFAALSSVVETRDLDISQESGQKQAIRAYLEATNYGTPEEIQDEIYSLEDRGDLEKKARQFKPKLDAMEEQRVNQKLQHQEEQNKLRQEKSQNYIESVYGTLEKGQIGGVEIDEKVQNMLYSGLVQSNYPSASGRQTNMLGHLLEKHQWGPEPRHDLIAEALWLLADPEGYRGSIKGSAEKKAAEKTMRTLKTEANNKNTSSPTGVERESTSMTRGSRGVARPKRDFFSR